MIYIKKKDAVKKGKKLETEIAKIARKNKFKVIKNSYIGFKSRNSIKYTEVDIILISKKGIVIIESKNYSGKIEGYIDEDKLIIKYSNNRSYKIINPIKQNNTHTWAVRKFLGLDDNKNDNKFKNLVVISESTVIEDLKGDISNIIKIEDLDKYLKEINKQDDTITSAKTSSYYNKLNKRSKVSKTVKNRHIKQLKNKK